MLLDPVLAISNIFPLWPLLPAKIVESESAKEVLLINTLARKIDTCF
jgi:hypothetical protein